MEKSQSERFNEMKRLYAELKSNPQDEDIRSKLHTSFEAIFRHFENLADSPDKVTPGDREESVEFKQFLDQLDARIYDGETVHNSPLCFGFRTPQTRRS